MKYLPQRPVQLHEPPPSAPAPSTANPIKASPRGRPTSSPPQVSSTSSQRIKGTAAVTTTTSVATARGNHTRLSPPEGRITSPKSHLVKLTMAPQQLDKKDLPSIEPYTSKPCPAPVSRDRPHSSPAVRGEPPQGRRDNQTPTSLSGQTAARNGARRRKGGHEVVAVTGVNQRAKEEEEEVKEKPRPKTADGRDIEALRLKIPLLNDPADPAMIAHRY